MSAKTKSPLPDTPNNKVSPATPTRVSRLTRGVAKSAADSPSPTQNPRISVDRSPRSANGKPAVDRRSPKLATPPEKPSARTAKGTEVQAPRVSKGAELQAQLNVAQEDLTKAKEKLVSVEQEKAQAIDALKEAQRLADEANEKLQEALVAQKRAEENSEIEKFRAVEMEQAGIEASQKKEEEWHKELEDVRNQHALDVASLLSANQELQRVKQELADIFEAKNQALSHADESAKVVEVHAEKVEILSAELVRLKALLNSKLEMETNDQTRLVSELSSEIESLKHKLEEAESYELKLEMETNNQTRLVSELNSEIESLKQKLEDAKSYEEKLEMETADQTRLVSELNSEIESLKQELEEAKSYEEKLEMETKSQARLVSELNSEIVSLKQELEEARSYEEKVLEQENVIEQLNVEVEAAKMAESYSRNLADELQKKVQDLQARAAEANQLKRSASESVESVMKQLEGTNYLLNEAESEIESLREKVGLLEMSTSQHRGDLDESERRFNSVKEEAAELAKEVEFLKSELETVTEEKVHALDNEKLAATSVQTLLEEKNKIINDLEISRDEEEKSKKAMESLAAALHEVSLEAREAKEKLKSSEVENENYVAQIEDLRLLLKATNEKYEMMLDEAKHEIDVLTSAADQTKVDFENFKVESEQKELHLMSCVKKSEDENSSMEKEINRLVNSLKEAEEETHTTAEEGIQLKKSLKEAEAEVVYLQEVLGEAKAESMKLKESLMDKENELQGVIEENEELRTRDVSSHQKIEELSKMLDEAVTEKQTHQNGLADENGELSDSEQDYDMLPKVIEFSEQNGDGTEEKLKEEVPVQQYDDQPTKEETLIVTDLLGEEEESPTGETVKSNGNLKDHEIVDKESPVEVDSKMWEIGKTDEKELLPERVQGQESFDDDLDLKLDGSESGDHVNGLSSAETTENGKTSPSKEQIAKKKKPLFRKFGGLLKKKSSGGNEK